MNKICPYCNSKNVGKILYGMPMFTKKLEKEMASGKIKLGGCCIIDDSPLYHCNDCGKEWGKLIVK
jgi:DNA-directed RNA polymerase subunit RPC12/RpoP